MNRPPSMANCHAVHREEVYLPYLPLMSISMDFLYKATKNIIKDINCMDK